MLHLVDQPESDLVEMVTKSSIAIVVSNPRLHDNPIVVCNDAFLELTGYSKDDIIGHNCRFLVGKDTKVEHTETIRSAIQSHRPVLVEILNYKRDGTAFCNALMITPVFDENGQLTYYIGSQMEVLSNVSESVSTRKSLAIEKVESLTPKQKAVLTQMAQGYKNKQIAHILKISISTVKMHRSQILSKVDALTSVEAIRIAVEAGL